MKHTIFTLIAIALLPGAYAQEKYPASSNFQMEDARRLHQRMYAEETQCHDVTFTTTGAWTSGFSSDHEMPWVSISPDRGNAAGTYTVSIAMEVNKTGEDRLEEIIITCNEEDMIIGIYQDGAGTSGCADDVFVSDGDVYIAGKEGHYATLWKNGVAQHLTDRSDDGRAFSVYVSGDDVYVAGIENRCAVLWENGVRQRLTDGSTMVWIESVFVSGSDVFVSGEEYNEEDKYIAKIWKNGKVQELSNGEHNAYASSVFVSDSDVYVAGYEVNEKGNIVAILWKNGEPHSLTDGKKNAWARSVYVSDGDVYVAGEESGIVKVWKNGVPEDISRGTAKSIFVSGGDVYVAGNEGSSTSERGRATLWKNGFSDNDLADDYGTFANAVFVSGEDVYVAGESFGDVAGFWKNGKIHNLTYIPSRDDDENYDDSYDEEPEYNTINELRGYVGQGNAKALLEYVNYLTPEQQEETEIDFTFDKKNTVISIILEMERFDLFGYFMKDEAETKRWTNEFLYSSAGRGHLKAVKYLVSKGADVNKPQANGYTPVIAALENNCMEVAEYLVSRGSDLNLMVGDYYPNESYKTPLLFKYYYQNRNASSYYDENYVHLRRLIEAGADIDARYHNGKTLLFNVDSKDLKLANYLIRHGADVNAKDSEGKTPLFGTSLKMTRLLIDNGADVNAADNNMQTPLFHALYDYAEDDVLKYLIEKGANVNYKDKNGLTPLHIAAKRSLGRVKLLVENGADIHAKDNDGHTPIYHTDGSSGSGTKIIEYLKSKGAEDKDAGMGGWFDIKFSM